MIDVNVNKILGDARRQEASIRNAAWERHIARITRELREDLAGLDCPAVRQSKVSVQEIPFDLRPDQVVRPNYHPVVLRERPEGGVEVLHPVTGELLAVHEDGVIVI